MMAKLNDAYTIKFRVDAPDASGLRMRLARFLVFLVTFLIRVKVRAHVDTRQATRAAEIEPNLRLIYRGTEMPSEPPANLAGRDEGFPLDTEAEDSNCIDCGKSLERFTSFHHYGHEPLCGGCYITRQADEPGIKFTDVKIEPEEMHFGRMFTAPNRMTIAYECRRCKTAITHEKAVFDEDLNTYHSFCHRLKFGSFGEI